jgi:methionyl-tRNA formyltransferase
MKILFLGVPYNPVIGFLKERGEQVISTMEPVTPSIIDEHGIDFVISYGYRVILRKDFLDKLPGRIINLHISYLPYNRGADPNFWSYVEGTPAGVSCHLVDEGIDTGAILWRKEMVRDESSTLTDTYAALHELMFAEFCRNWPAMKQGKLPPIPQSTLGPATSHRSKDKFRYVTQGQTAYLDVRISDLLDYIGDIQLSAANRNTVLDELT